MAENVKTENMSVQKKDKGKFFRKMIVTLKYRPKIIPVIVLIIGYVLLSLNLANISETTLYINRTNMGLYIFVSYLLSVLSLVCLLNAFPNREKPRIVFIVLAFVLLAVVVTMDALYISTVATKLNELQTTTNNAGVILWEALLNSGSNRPEQMLSAKTWVTVHMVFECVVIVLVALLPAIKRLMRKINTRVVIEENENIASIDLSEGDEAEAKRSGGMRATK